MQSHSSSWWRYCTIFVVVNGLELTKKKSRNQKNIFNVSSRRYFAWGLTDIYSRWNYFLSHFFGFIGGNNGVTWYVPIFFVNHSSFFMIICYKIKDLRLCKVQVTFPNTRRKQWNVHLKRYSYLFLVYFISTINFLLACELYI